MSSQRRASVISFVLSLIAIGFTFISISSLTEANNTAGDKFYFLKKQGFWIIVSLLAFYIASKNYVRRNYYILPDITSFSNNTTGHNMRKMPDFGSLTDLAIRINNSCFVSKVFFHIISYLAI